MPLKKDSPSKRLRYQKNKISKIRQKSDDTQRRKNELEGINQIQFEDLQLQLDSTSKEPIIPIKHETRNLINQSTSLDSHAKKPLELMRQSSPKPPKYPAKHISEKMNPFEIGTDQRSTPEKPGYVSQGLSYNLASSELGELRVMKNKEEIKLSPQFERLEKKLLQLKLDSAIKPIQQQQNSGIESSGNSNQKQRLEEKKTLEGERRSRKERKLQLKSENQQIFLSSEIFDSLEVNTRAKVQNPLQGKRIDIKE